MTYTAVEANWEWTKLSWGTHIRSAVLTYVLMTCCNLKAVRQHEFILNTNDNVSIRTLWN